MATLPNIFVSFKQLANNFIERSQRGNVILILKDSTDTTFTLKQYQDSLEFGEDEAKYTADNKLYIQDAFLGNPANVYVLRIDDTATLTNGDLDVIKGIGTGWIGGYDLSQEETDILIAWIVSVRAEKMTFKAVVTNPKQAPDNKAIVEINKDMTAIFDDTRESKTANDVIPTLIGLIAGANVEKGTTYLELKNLISVINTVESQTDIDAGKMPLIVDENVVKIGLGINSLTTFENDVDDERYIEIIEVQDLINDDLIKTFKKYVGRKNSLDTQMIVISSVNNYFKGLASSEILDPNYMNKANIDVVTQREAWAKIKTEASNWDDTMVMNNVYKNQMFLCANIKILFAVKDIELNITMNN